MDATTRTFLEEKLSGLATKEDLKKLATKEDVENLALATAKGFADVDTRFKEMDTRFSGRFNQLEGKVDIIDDRLDETESLDIKHLTRRTTLLEKQVQELRQK